MNWRRRPQLEPWVGGRVGGPTSMGGGRSTGPERRPWPRPVHPLSLPPLPGTVASAHLLTNRGYAHLPSANLYLYFFCFFYSIYLYLYCCFSSSADQLRIHTSANCKFYPGVFLRNCCLLFPHLTSSGGYIYLLLPNFSPQPKYYGKKNRHTLWHCPLFILFLTDVISTAKRCS